MRLIELSAAGPISLSVCAVGREHWKGRPIASPLEKVGGAALLWTIFAILLIGWLLGLVGVYQIGSIIHLLLVVALIVLIVQLVTGRRTVL
jgi:uncharacterized protein DUF5670